MSYTLVPTAPRPSEASASPAARTDVPAEKAVQPPTETAANRPAAENNFAKAEANIKREEFRDKITDSIVFRAVDLTTGEVVQQIPEESILRLRRAFAETTQKNMTGLAFSRSL
jgi:flagellar protein FlaG